MPGIAWFRTQVQLSPPPGQDSLIGLRITDDASRNYQARLSVNGWHMGLYINNLGPRTLFILPNGILPARGNNTLPIAVWSFGDATGGPGEVFLVDPGTVRGRVPVADVPAPDYDPGILIG